MEKNVKFFIVFFLILVTSCSSIKKADNSTRDGSSFKKAIKVKDIVQEYEYVKKVCVNCQVIEQSLAFDKNKPYDILVAIKPNGEKVSYYFDISKFFGKLY